MQDDELLIIVGRSVSVNARYKKNLLDESNTRVGGKIEVEIHYNRSIL